MESARLLRRRDCTCLRRKAGRRGERRRRGRKCALLLLLLPLLLLRPLRGLAASTRSLPRDLWKVYTSPCLDDETTGLCKRKVDRVVVPPASTLIAIFLCRVCLYIERVLPPHALLFDVVFTTIINVLLCDSPLYSLVHHPLCLNASSTCLAYLVVYCGRLLCNVVYP